jgi:glutamine synthetase
VSSTRGSQYLRRRGRRAVATVPQSYIAGLQRYTPELISLYAPNVNSYRRLAPEISAPINLNWGLDNRTVAFRVPNSPVEATRVENRFPGADANPYLAIAATLASGLLGMQRGAQAHGTAPRHGERG